MTLTLYHKLNLAMNWDWVLNSSKLQGILKQARILSSKHKRVATIIKIGLLPLIFTLFYNQQLYKLLYGSLDQYNII